MKRHTLSPVTWELDNSYPKKSVSSDITIGILSLQGDFLEHIQTLTRLGVTSREIRLPKDLENIDGLILPGGESTTIARLLDVFDLRVPLITAINLGLPVWGTCAGMILLAKKLIQDRPIPLGVMDIQVNRNAFGRQKDSFATNLQINVLGKTPVHATFIRAPQIVSVGKNVVILASLPDGTVVAAKQKNMVVTSFHPELTDDVRFHEFFTRLIQKNNLESNRMHFK